MTEQETAAKARERLGWTKAQLKAEARERKLGPDASPNGPTSWVEAVDAERIRKVLAAADAGETLGDAPAVSSTNGPAQYHEPGIGSALSTLNEALAAALARPAGIDADAVQRIVDARVDDAVAAAMSAAKVSRIIVESVEPRRVEFDASGQHENFALALSLVAAGIPTLLVGPKGSGKSEAARAIAEALGLAFHADSFSMDSGRHDVFGFMDAQGRYVPAAFRAPYEKGGLYNGDEMDNGTANLGAAFNLALSNGHAAFPDAFVMRHPDFRMMGTANAPHGATLTYTGREAMDAALLDRFAVVPWPIDEAFERRLALAHNGNAGAWVDTVQRVRKAADAAGLDRFSPSPRASIYGAKMLAAGMSREQALDVFIYRGADADTRARLAGAAK